MSPAPGSRLDCRQRFAASFELDRIHAGFLKEASGIANRFGGGNLVGHERHVTDQMRAARASGHGLAVVNHVFHGHRKGVLVTQHHHAQRIADQDGIHAGAIERQRGRVVVGGDHGDRFTAFLLCGQAEHGHLATVGINGNRHNICSCGIPLISGIFWRCFRNRTRLSAMLSAHR
jgi:hypothetical protein